VAEWNDFLQNDDAQRGGAARAAGDPGDGIPSGIEELLDELQEKLARLSPKSRSSRPFLTYFSPNDPRGRVAGRLGAGRRKYRDIPRRFCDTLTP
jgi:hypothetical protein